MSASAEYSAAYDVAIAGASIAGCTAAALFAREGLSVALIERNPDPAAFKALCTTYIQSCATPVIERLGLAALIEATGGVRNDIEIWTRWGWIRDPGARPGRRPAHGYNIRRETLDPMLRSLAASTPGVDYFPGHAVSAVLAEGRRVRGVRVEPAGAPAREITARLVVGADGRSSRVAELASMRARTTPNNRFFYLAHFRGLASTSGTRSQMWFREPDVGYTFPHDGGVTIVAAMPARDKLDAWRGDLEGSFMRFFEALPGGPDLRGAQRVGPIRGALKLPNIARQAASPGLALIGDAALASDPLWGVGCGWAFQSAEWLVDLASGALRSRGDVDGALDRYRRHHRRMLAGHHFLTSDYAKARPFNPLEALMFSAAARDAACADHLSEFGTRNIGAGTFLSPVAIARAARVNIAYRFRRSSAAEPRGLPHPT